ncbi:DUF6658 family protein [Leptolyngbya sp. FACHB-711]|uniref:DUF6658 family protein n=1 Tax=unclassified Leptolyngbya TaxID=2650499 RepID=UPI001682C97F|nr:DUF6658 family protein [Leptolyngbya sp. FACHB-711]MBD1850806.1 hypothetical protein [Cyanobacteria bacterium FACHB-502]MBD2023502.1 hypothetical protein [Leptolyngbya sp. FACHB-711]
MKQVVSWLKQLRIARLAIVLVAGFTLLLTSCNSGNIQGARPEVPPVQMGGQNNPYKGGGDGYTDYKMSTDPKVSGEHGNRNTKPMMRSSLIGNGELIASSDVKSNSAQDILYPGDDAERSKNPDVGPVGQDYREKIIKNTETATPEKQPIIQRSNPNEKILEKIGDQFQQSTDFIKDALEGQAEGQSK